MNIAVDMTAFLGPMSKNRGIGNYALGQFKKMVEIDSLNTYIFVNFFEEDGVSEYFLGCDNITELFLYTGKDRFLLDKPEYKEVFGDIIKHIISEYSIEVFYITSPFDGSIHPYNQSWFEGVKTVATVYDIIPYVFKERYLVGKQSLNWYMKCVEMLKWVDCCFAISESVKQDMVQYLGFDGERIQVVHGAVDDRFRIIDISENQIRSLKEKYGIVDKFIMCTGGDDDRKNIGELIVAYSQLPKNLVSEYQLVIVCKLSPYAVEKYRKISQSSDVEDRVVFTNFVTNEELVMFYNMTNLLAFPSQYEGFGLPVVEAMSCGTPVLTSNNSSLVEIAQGAAILVDPFSTQDITRGLEVALVHTDLSALVKNGKEKIGKYTWDIVAKKIISTINNFEKTIKSDFINDKSKNKIAFFSPLPPLESGISDYSLDIINELSNFIDVDVFVDDKYIPNCNLAGNVRVLNHSVFKRMSKEYTDIVYQMGNSLFHVYMYDYIQKYPGTIVLHDYNMHEVAHAVTLHMGKSDMKLYQQYLNEDFPKNVVKEYVDNLKTGVCGPKIYQMELNGFIVNHAKKIIVHSDYAKEKLLMKDISRQVKKIFSYARIKPLLNCSSSKVSLGYSENEIIIAAFGHIHTTKRAMPILEAFKRICESHENVKCLFVGKLDASIEGEFNAFVIENELSNRVEVTGYTTLDKFEHYIDATDICLNLRHPYNGETSGSLMRILSKGKCVIVNNIGSFSEVPDGCCIKLPSVNEMGEHQEVDTIYESLKEVILNEGIRDAVSRNAREFAEGNLDIKMVAQDYLKFIKYDKVAHLSEQSLLDIVNHEIRQFKYTNTEIEQLSKTLAYGMMR